MLELAVVFGGSFTLALSGALMPGPLLTVTIAESAHRGFVAGPLLMVGHAVLELALVVAIILGLGPFLKIPQVMGGIALVGGAILIWMGIQMIRTARNISLNMDGPEGRVSSYPVLTGILASLSNPYWILWWATIGLGYLVAAIKLGVLGVGVFFVGHIAADFLWYSIVSYGISRGKRILKDRAYQHIIRFCGIFLLGFGGWFLLAGRTYLGRCPL
ncbi:MAG: lysine transporter LysE [Deltaproteobacteria bacterium]|nr:MAG: lysine transporter LysE [Deltaproteobacteria bacterium]